MLRLLEAFPTSYVGVGFFRSAVSAHADEFRKKEYSYSSLLYFADVISKGKMKKVTLSSKNQSHCLTVSIILLHKASRIMQQKTFP